MLDSISKAKIKATVKHYRRTHAEDYAMVCEAIAGKRKLLSNEFASVEGTHLDMRALFEIPETLFTDLIMALGEDEMLAFKTKEGSRWFAATFPEFCLPESL